MKAVVTGMIATYPVGGVLYDYAQYAVALERLGFEVYYLEDTGLQTFDPRTGMYGIDASYGVSFLAEHLARLSPGLARKWHYRSADGVRHGMDQAQIEAVVSNCDVFLNVSGASMLRDAYLPSPRKVLIDTDPGWNHFVNYPRWDAGGGWVGDHGFRAHDFFFTYATNIGRANCNLPDFGLDWQTTVPPVIVDLWHAEPPGDVWTTVLTWKNFSNSITHLGRSYGTKEMEFDKVAPIPQLLPYRFEVAVGGAQPPIEEWRARGWSVIDSVARSLTPERYRSYIQSSRGEFSVAKNVYVDTGSGWFSCRSVCYLAAGRPVVVQDTGFSTSIPVGDGLLAFSTLEEAADSVSRVEADYTHHQAAARELARTHFSGGVVLSDILKGIGL